METLKAQTVILFREPGQVRRGYKTFVRNVKIYRHNPGIGLVKLNGVPKLVALTPSGKWEVR